MTLTTISEYQTNNVGSLVSAIISSAGGDRITDVDSASAEGIAIYSLTSGNGTWQYSLNNGTTWTSIGTVNGTSALLLSSVDKVRFVPASPTVVTASFTFRAWDQSVGTAGAYVSLASNGGITPFSTATSTASMTIVPYGVSLNPVVGTEGLPSSVTGSLTGIDPALAHTVEISWGDGSANTTISVPAGQSTFSTTKTYADNNILSPATPYGLGMTLRQGATILRTSSSTATIGNTAPTFDSTDSTFGTAGIPQQFKFPSFRDPGFSLFSRFETFSSVSVAWGDGQSETISASITNGTFGTSTVGILESRNHTYAAPGVYTITLSVTDDDGNTGSGIVLARIGNVSVDDPYTVPGQNGSFSSVTLKIVNNPFEASYRNELGMYIIDDNSGATHSNPVTDSALPIVVPANVSNVANYLKASLNSPSRQIVFPRYSPTGTTTTIVLPAGTKVGFYIVQDSSTAEQLSKNPNNTLSADRINSPNTFFSFAQANPDYSASTAFPNFKHFRHVTYPDNPGTPVDESRTERFDVEDLDANDPGLDADYNDIVFEVTAAPNTLASPKFHVVDANMDRNFQYSATTDWTGATLLESTNTSPKGNASNATGSRMWVVDSNNSVYVYDLNPTTGAQTYVGKWAILDLPVGSTVHDIAMVGTSILIVTQSSTAGDRKVYRFGGGTAGTAADATTWVTGSHSATINNPTTNPVSSFALSNLTGKINSSPTGLAANASTIWVTDDASDDVYVYSFAGTLTAKWKLAATNLDVTDITNDPSGSSSDLWSVDRVTKKIYRYANGATAPDSATAAIATTTDLAYASIDPQGIADPPPGWTATIQWTGNVSNDWNNISNWNLGRVPNLNDDVLIPAGKTVTISSGAIVAKSLVANGTLNLNGGSLELAQESEVSTLNVSGGDFSVSANLTVINQLNWGAGNISRVGQSSPSFVIALTAVANVRGAGVKSLSINYVNRGTTNLGGKVQVVYDGFDSTNPTTYISNESNAQFVLESGANLEVDETPWVISASLPGKYPRLDNFGTLSSQLGSNTKLDVELFNKPSGSVFFEQGTHQISGGIRNEGYLEVRQSATLLLYCELSYNIDGVDFAVVGSDNPLVQSAGTTKLQGGDIVAAAFTGNFLFNGGTLEGYGSVLGNLTNSAQVLLRDDDKTLLISGDYIQSPQGNLTLSAVSANALGHNQLKVSGTVLLDGNVNVSNMPSGQ